MTLPPSAVAGLIPQTDKKAIVAASAGNAMEWYDFTVFALMTPVIKNLFFPVDPNLPGSEINARLLTTALFGTGFFMRQSAASCSAISVIVEGARPP